VKTITPKEPTTRQQTLALLIAKKPTHTPYPALAAPFEAINP
jgi:hypothetical protein